MVDSQCGGEEPMQIAVTDEMKLNGNVQRDRRNIDALKHMGWRPLVIGECETTDTDRLSERLRSFLDGDAQRPSGKS